MIYKLPKEKVKLVKPLFKKMQPNHSSLGQYFLGERPGQTLIKEKWFHSYCKTTSLLFHL